MDTPGHDVEAVTGMVAGGAQGVVFSTGRGTPAGFSIAPVIRVTGNPEAFARMQENIDVDARPTLEGAIHPKDVGEQIFRLILEVCAGRQTKAELLGHQESLSIWRAAWRFGLAVILAESSPYSSWLASQIPYY
jgi:altronate dehydratase large subunit